MKDNILILIIVGCMVFSQIDFCNHEEPKKYVDGTLFQHCKTHGVKIVKSEGIKQDCECKD